MKYKYYFLPLDLYGRPAGWFEEIYLTEEEAAELKSRNPYVYTNFAAATARAID